MNPVLPKNYSDDFEQVLSQQPYNNYREVLPVVKYSNCYFTHSGIGLKRFKLIRETLFANITKKHRRHFYKFALYKYFLGKKIRVTGDNILLIHNHWSTGYHHWLTECLLKILLIDPSQYCLILPEDYGKFAFDSASLFNFKEVITISPNCGLTADKITVIANPNSGHYNPSSIILLRQQLIEKCVSKCASLEACDYVYISRGKERLRKVENEDAVMDLLSWYGFKVIDINKLNFYEQVMLFSKCKVYVSIHGAALTNAMFMPRGGKVLELYRSLNDKAAWMNTCYWNLVTASGLDYYYQFCEHGNNIGTSADSCNIIVDIPKLEGNIKMMLGK